MESKITSSSLPNYQWSTGSKTYTHSTVEYNVIGSSTPLPRYFRAYLKIITGNPSGPMQYMSLGISKDPITSDQILTKKWLATKPEQWTMTVTWNPLLLASAKFWYNNQSCPYGTPFKQGDTVCIFCNKDNTISYEINGKSCGVAFGSIHGPLYLTADSMGMPISIEIEKVEDYTITEESKIPASYKKPPNASTVTCIQKATCLFFIKISRKA